MQGVVSKVQNLSALGTSLPKVILLKTVGVANVLKIEFTLRSLQRSSLDTTLRVISDKSSTGSFVMMDDMTLNAALEITGAHV